MTPAPHEIPDATQRSGVVGFIHRRIAVRLLIAWSILVVIVPGTAFVLEVARVKAVVHDLALRQAGDVSRALAADLQRGGDDAQRELRDLGQHLVAKDFVSVELYDDERRLVFEMMRDGTNSVGRRYRKYRHKFPREGEFTHELHFAGPDLILVNLMPLAGPSGTVSGYFESIYRVDPVTYASIRADVLRTVAFVTASVTLTALIFYPLVLALNRDVVRASAELFRGNLELLDVLGCAIAERDSDTNAHNYRVMYYALRFGERLKLPPGDMRDLLVGAFLHDIGKLGVRDAILLKPGALTQEEIEVMRTHVPLGVDLIEKSHWLRGARAVVQNHHERFDGGGYPVGLKGREIPLVARMFAIVDVFDALTSKRPYKPAWPVHEALASLKGQPGAVPQFDPALVESFSEIAPHLHAEASTSEASELKAVLSALVPRYFMAA